MEESRAFAPAAAAAERLEGGERLEVAHAKAANSQRRFNLGEEKEKTSEVHAQLARLIESKFIESNISSAQSQTGVRADRQSTAAAAANTLDALIEGRRSWSEQRPVIVDIRNSKRERRNATDEADQTQLRSRTDSSSEQKSSHQPIDTQPTTLAAHSTDAKLSAVAANQANSEEEKPETVQEDQQRAETNSSPAPEQQPEESLENDKTQLEQQQQDHYSNSAKGKTPPTFGVAPYKYSRLPYYSYHGKARNVNLVSSLDRPSKLLLRASDGESSGSSSSSRIPTLQAKGAHRSQVDELEEQQRIAARSLRANLRGYSNISNLFPSQPMSVRESRPNSNSNKSSARRYLNFRVNNPNESLGQRQKSASSSSLNRARSEQQVLSAPVNRSSTAATLERRSSLSKWNATKVDQNYNTYTRNKSLNSLSNDQHTMRRQNSSSAYGSKQRLTPGTPNYQNRSSSGYLSRQHRSPSASSLYYGPNLSPYGAPLMDPDCPVHGYSPVNNASVSKSTQQLSSAAAADPDLLYEPYPNYYDVVPRSGSLYSPTSPPPLNYSRAASSGGQNRPSAYYDNTSRFGVYHSPIDGVRSSLAPSNEQLRRILGYQPHTKPIHLHPQWAYSRPFIHLMGARSPSPDGEIRPQFSAFNQLQDSQAIRAVDFHPSGEVYAIGSNSRALRICAYPADHQLRHFNADHVLSPPRVLFKFLQLHRGSIYCVGFNATGQLLATGSNDQTVHLVRYNSTTHSPDGDEYRLTMHDGTVRDLCFIDDLTNGAALLLSAGGGDNKIYVTDCDTITPFQSMAGHTQMVMSLHHWSGANFVSASYDKTIRFWDLRTRACTSIISAPASRGTGGKWAGPGAPACSVKVDPSGRLLASGHSDSTCMLYDIRGARIIQAFKPHDDEIRTISFSPKSYYLLTGGYDGRIVLSDIQGDLTQPLASVCVAETDDKIIQSKWHPSDFTFVTTSADKKATLWALPTE